MRQVYFGDKSALRSLLVASAALNVGLLLWLTTALRPAADRAKVSGLNPADLSIRQCTFRYDMSGGVEKAIPCAIYVHNNSTRNQRGRLWFTVTPDYARLSKHALTAIFKAYPKRMEDMGKDQFFEKNSRASEIYGKMYSAFRILSGGSVLLEDLVLTSPAEVAPPVYGFSVEVDLPALSVSCIPHELVLPPQDKVHPLEITIVQSNTPG